MTAANESPVPEPGGTAAEAAREPDTVPSPNKSEEPVNEAPALHRSLKHNLLNIFNKIHLDDIILIGLIIMLLDEGMDDDFLLIILIYIFISGRL